LASVVIPTSVTSIGEVAFGACFSLKSIAIPDSVTNIGDYAFASSGLTNITFPNSVTDIAEYTFQYCTNLTSVTIPASITSIGEGAFEDCFSLTGIYFEGNAPSVVSTGLNPSFSGDNNLTIYHLPGTTDWFSTFGARPVALWVVPNPLIISSDSRLGVQSNGFGFIISCPSNISVVVEACTNLANPFWLSLQTNTLSAGQANFTDPDWTNYPERFYRVRVQ
jgi:hypothetical protein